MHSLFLAIALLAAADFPDVEENVIEDVESAAGEEPIVTPDDEFPAETRPAAKSPALQTPARSDPAQADATPFLSGYHDSLWNDSKAAVQRNYPEDRPLVAKGENQWMIRDKCEGEDALVLYRFNANDQLKAVVCQFRQGLEDSKPDFALYQKLRRTLVGQWGQPSNSNESPAPDSPSQAVEWAGKKGKAALVFSADESFVQLTVESKP